jgi:hypothetical protein
MKRPRLASLLPLAVLLALAGAGHVAVAQAAAGDPLEWPREILSQGYRVVLYQPQIESFADDWLESRAAVSLAKESGGTPLFGAVWTRARVATDLTDRLVYFKEISVTAIKFPSLDEGQTDRLKEVLETEIPKWELVVSLDRILASMDMLEVEQTTARNLDNTPPRVIYSETPAVLVVLHGDPILAKVENSDLQYVVNTPFFIVKDGSTYYLKGGDYWFSSAEVTSGWKSVPGVPEEVSKLAEKVVAEPEEGEAGADTTAAGEDGEEPEDTGPPVIYVATGPAELIVSSGAPEYAAIPDTDLLYMSNTESDVVMDIATQRYYLLLAGRWYTAATLADGDWKFVHPEDLPPDFARIPEDSDMADVRVSVPGTVEAKEAILETQIPQTAEVDRKTATVTVTYDGDPKFEKIPGTEMLYAVNSDKSVLVISGKYYVCDDAIWFVGPGRNGPWDVATSVPTEVQEIPPESPVYNVKYVYVYDSTPDIVYVGYTPGYVGSYAYYGTVVYGTGYWYRPWYGVHYYPRPVTWGFNVHYNPWTGWGFSVGVSYGWMSVGWGPAWHGWWGPRGYTMGYRHGYYHGYHRGYHHGYNRGYAQGARAGYRAGYRMGSNNGRPSPYANRNRGVVSTGARPSQRPAAGQQPGRGTAGRTPAAGQRPATGAVGKTPGAAQQGGWQTKTGAKNNVYTDKSGNVYRQNGNQWQKQDKGNWTKPDTPRQPGGGSTVERTQRDLNRQAQARDRGQQRTQQYQQGGRSTTRSSPQRSTSRSTGRSRSGGGRRH